MHKTTYLLVCGAVAKEVLAVIEANGWTHLDVQALPAVLHNDPNQIPIRVEARLAEVAGHYDHVLVGYGDCGTGGMLEHVLEKYGAQRLEGPHCYSFFAGASVFEALADEELGTFYLTDYLVRQFDTVFWHSMGLDRYPELLSTYFGSYKRVVYLAQIPDPDLDRRAQEAAQRLGLTYERVEVGMAPFDKAMKILVAPERNTAGSDG